MTPITLPDETDDIRNQLLSILKVAYLSRLTNRSISQSSAVVIFDFEKPKAALPCVHTQGYRQTKKKERKKEENKQCNG
jgi:hypothetical protein